MLVDIFRMRTCYQVISLPPVHPSVTDECPTVCNLRNALTVSDIGDALWAYRNPSSDISIAAQSKP